MMAETKTLLIVAHAPSTNTAALKDAVLRGAGHEEIDGVTARWIPPLEAGAADVRAADGIILGTTENLGYMSGALKDFFDRTYYRVIEEKEGLPYLLYIRAGLDGTGTKRAVTGICSGLRWNPVQDPTIFHGEWDDAFLGQAEELGQLMAAGLEAGIF
ncbi:NAD(P)H-dependent oxidoreductase [Marivibrio halodurans]|uniref:NAD(P)H-dependent oxidoreductase n=1 Tax=Marivibrio halodurans TaxID=2039722 RepID=A0A8J7V3P6_9PROT|nr:NAD(P)H-dependent oxidoreductase [Marivibrio halodurans]MBP5858491.1 NAD(P)H-dependent oxidoreductase [Marivibrio halodurans]